MSNPAFKKARAPRVTKMVPPVATGPTHLSKLIVDTRDGMGMKQNALADAWGRTQPWVHTVESGKVWDLGYYEIMMLARALGIPKERILDALHRTYLDLMVSAGPMGTEGIPDEDSGQVLMVTKTGGLKVVAQDPAIKGLTRLEGVIALNPDMRWSGVQEQKIDIGTLPMVEDESLSESPTGPNA